MKPAAAAYPDGFILGCFIGMTEKEVSMEELIKKLNADLAVEVMAREDARRIYRGEAETEKLAYYTGRIEYIQSLMDFIKKNGKK